MKRLMILEELARIGGPATPTEVNKRLKMSKQTLHRTFGQLLDEGFLQLEHDGRSYSPGDRIRNLAVGIISSSHIRSARLVIMTALSKRIGETCNFVIPNRDGMIYLDRVETNWPLRIHLPVGTKVPFHCTASGKLYLSTLSPTLLERTIEALDLEPMTERTITDNGALRAEIARIAEQGYAEDDEEFVDGMISIAVPVTDAHKRFVSCLSIHAPSMRMPLEKARDYLDDIKASAAKLAKFSANKDEN